MVFRKITIDNSVRFFPKIEQTKKIKQNKIKKVNKFNPFQEEVNQTRGNKTKNFQKVIKNLLRILQQEDLEYLNEY